MSYLPVKRLAGSPNVSTERVTHPPALPSNYQGEWININQYYYQLNRPLGKGTFATVYRGLRPRSNGQWEDIAVKCIAIGDAGTSKGTTRLNRIWDEIRFMRKLIHPNILRLYDIHLAMEEEAMYLFLECCDGGSLWPYTHRDWLTPSQLCSVCRQIRDGLHYLYQQSILHRDLKPQNLLLLHGPQDLIVKISDFGLSTLVEGELFTTVCGSPLYMAPEIIDGQPYTNKSDLWSLGLILYQLVYHRHPYLSETREELARKIKLQINYQTTQRLNTSGSALLRQLLVYDPALRLSWDGFLNHAWFRQASPLKPAPLQQRLIPRTALETVPNAAKLATPMVTSSPDSPDDSRGRGNVQLSFLLVERQPPAPAVSPASGYSHTPKATDAEEVFTLSIRSGPGPGKNSVDVPSGGLSPSSSSNDSSSDAYFSAHDHSSRVEPQTNRGPYPPLPSPPLEALDREEPPCEPLPPLPSETPMGKSLRTLVVEDYRPTPLGESLSYSARGPSIGNAMIGRGLGASPEEIAASAPIPIRGKNYLLAHGLDLNSSMRNISGQSHSAQASASSWLGKAGKGLKSWLHGK